MKQIYSTREVAEFVGADHWRVMRLFEIGDLPEPPRFARRRIITPDLIPSIVHALEERGWLPSKKEATEELLA